MNNQNSNNQNNLFDFYSQVFESFNKCSAAITKPRVPKSQAEIEGLRCKINDNDYMSDAIKKTADIIVKSEVKKWN